VNRAGRVSEYAHGEAVVGPLPTLVCLLKPAQGVIEQARPGWCHSTGGLDAVSGGPDGPGAGQNAVAHSGHAWIGRRRSRRGPAKPCHRWPRTICS
jgi:hypothetical protein